MRWFNDNELSGDDIFAGTLVTLWIGCLFGKWFPVTDLGEAAGLQLFVVAIWFILISALMTWLFTLKQRKSSQRDRSVMEKTASAKELDRRLRTPEGKASIAKALNDHMENVVKGMNR